MPPVHEPVGSFASTGLIHTLAWLAIIAVLGLLAFATPAFRHHLSKHREQVHTHLYGPTAPAASAAADGPDAAAAEAAPAVPADDFDYSIYDAPPS